MKLKNRKTGEIVEWFNNTDGVFPNSLAELNEEWCDYEEPKEWFTINKFDGSIQEINDDTCAWTDEEKESIAELGFRFETEEEAEKAVEKLKAFKRLKDKGFRFSGWTIDDGLRISICTNTDEDDIYDEDKRRIKPDLDLLFGGKE